MNFLKTIFVLTVCFMYSLTSVFAQTKMSLYTKTVDWSALKTSNPKLYRDSVAWLEEIEAKYAEGVLKKVLDDLLVQKIIPAIGEHNKITDHVVLKEVMSEIWGPFFNGEISAEYSSYERPESILDYLLGNSVAGSSVVVSVPLASSITLDTLLIHMYHSLTNGTLNDGTQDGVELSSTLSAPVIFYALSNLYPTWGATKSAYGSGVITSVLFSGTSINLSSSESLSGEGYYTVGQGLKDKKQEMIERQKQEYDLYNFYVAQEESASILQALFPKLSRSEISLRLRNAASVNNPYERAIILFQGNPEYIAQINLALIISESLDQNVTDAAFNEIALKAQKRFQKTLRGSNELPNEIGKYLKSLIDKYPKDTVMLEMASDVFQQKIELFLEGI